MKKIWTKSEKNIAPTVYTASTQRYRYSKINTKTDIEYLQDTKPRCKGDHWVIWDNHRNIQIN